MIHSEPSTAEYICEFCGKLFDAEVLWFDQGHHENCEIEGRHHHPKTPICPECLSGKDAMDKPIGIMSDGLTWVAVHGNLLLALRHPDNKGASRKLVIQFTKRLGEILEQEGAVTPNILRHTYRLEAEAGNKEFTQENEEADHA